MSEQDASDPAEAAEEQPGATEQEGDASGEPVQPDEVIDPDEAGDGDASSEATGDDEVTVDEELVDRVAESDPESVAHELAALRSRVDGLEDQLDARDEELDDLAEKLKRKQAEFQNFKKRMEKRREEERERATEDLVTRLLDVRDNLKRALEQDEDTDIRGGVESTLRSFDDVLDQENVDVIEPEPGQDVDPHRHEVLVRVDSDQPEGAIADVHRPGYVMADKVLREAQVTVSDG
ncbi:nucleotide exchange factor GrpE [Halosimplex rubrum]|uniref:Protein GrpE n=1 Tax=Halosimplex rubrum TaxID=869889 RepID=A0A7D5T0C0_9EURY|nr:nucleotide exchange factor GrpE [Halosimplex rubrum]QLH79451.1 nucleotide exchange factor GrpE [Halosimplex rubrum]